MKIYIAGKITGLDDYKLEFNKAESLLQGRGHKVMNPSILPKGFSHKEYMHVCYAMIDICDATYMLPNWVESKGATMEHNYSVRIDKQIMYGEE